MEVNWNWKLPGDSALTHTWIKKEPKCPEQNTNDYDTVINDASEEVKDSKKIVGHISDDNKQWFMKSDSGFNHNKEIKKGHGDLQCETFQYSNTSADGYNCFRSLSTGCVESIEVKSEGDTCNVLDSGKVSQSDNGKSEAEIKFGRIKIDLRCDEEDSEEITEKREFVETETFEGRQSENGDDFIRLTYSCDKFSEKFKSKKDLKKHKKSQHEETEHTCNVCAAVFSTNHTLSSHILKHKMGDRFKCNKCSKTFNDRSNFNRHYETHFPGKPLECKICGKMSSSRERLKGHLMGHMGTNPLQCTKCRRTFVWESDLKRYIESHTGKKKTFVIIYKEDHRQKRIAKQSIS